MNDKGISRSALQRLPLYLGYLKSLPPGANQRISATALAAALNLGEVQVRKDLALVSSQGRPRVGYAVDGLVTALEAYLGYNDVDDALIVGAGKLGKALLEYDGFREYGLNIVAAFDSEPNVCGTTASGKPIYPLDALEAFCRERPVHIGIITVPAAGAQAVCNRLVKNGIRAVWNFAPFPLDAPPHIVVQNENMASSLALLSRHLAKQLLSS